LTAYDGLAAEARLAGLGQCDDAIMFAQKLIEHALETSSAAAAFLL
jgi:hypothetical protein